MTDATDIFNNSYETEGQGVGVILRDNGKQLIILTEKNVVDKADKLSVTFVNDMMADAALVKYDSNTGIAIISVDKSLLDDATIRAIAVAELGNSNIVSASRSGVKSGSSIIKAPPVSAMDFAFASWCASAER